MYFANSRQPGPLMTLLQPFDVGADCGRAGFDAAVITLDKRLGGGGLAGGIIEIGTHVVMQRALVVLQRPGVVTVLIDDLLGDAGQGSARTAGGMPEEGI